MITRYIHDLLQSHDRVIVPNFGAFLKSKGKVRNIIFNEFIKFNDGQLIGYIAEKEKLESTEATQKIDEFVGDIRKKIDEGSRVEVEGIGFLYKDEQDRVRFTEKPEEEKPVAGPKEEKVQKKEEASKKKEDKIEAKPKKEAPAKEVEKKQAKPKEEKPPEDKADQQKKIKVDFKPPVIAGQPEDKTPQEAKPSEKKSKPQPEKQAKTEATPTGDKDLKSEPGKAKISQEDPRIKFSPKEDIQERKSKAAWWWLLLLIPIIAIVIWLVVDYEGVKSIFKSEPTSSEQVTPQETPVVEDTATQIAPTGDLTAGGQTGQTGQAVEGQIEEEVIVEEVIEETVETPPVSPPKKYHLIAGVFSEKSNAENLVNKLVERGFYAEIIGRIDDLYYVSYASFETRSDALYELNHVVDEGYETWLYYY